MVTEPNVPKCSVIHLLIRGELAVVELQGACVVVDGSCSASYYERNRWVSKVPRPRLQTVDGGEPWICKKSLGEGEAARRGRRWRPRSYLRFRHGPCRAL